MPKLAHKVRPATLAVLRFQRDEAEQWLRDRLEDFIDHPGDLPGLLEQLETDYLPRYRAAHMRVRKAERKETRG